MIKVVSKTFDVDFFIVLVKMQNKLNLKLNNDDDFE